jgi:hypothetical protein
VSRFRMAILLALVAVTALPTTAHARRLAYCHLFSPSAVGKASGYRGIVVSGYEGDSPTFTNSHGRMQVCDFASGRDPVAESSVITFRTAATTAKEFTMQIKARRGQGDAAPKRVSGPWKQAYAFANGEMYVLKGRHIFHEQFTVRVTARAARALAVKAAHGL